MRAIALIEQPNHVCYRYRLEAYLPEFQRRGHALTAEPIAKSLAARIRQFFRATDADVVILQRKLLPLWQLALLRKAARRLVYDFDDALFHRDSYAAKGISSRSRMWRFWAAAYASDGIVAGNRFLADQARQFVDADRVQIIPTSLRPEHYRLAAHDASRRPIRMAWIGQPSTLVGLTQAQAQLAAAAAAVPQCELRVICSRAPRLSGVRVDFRRWSAETEARDLAGADIGVSWLPDDAWSRGKCALKVLQYMAAGLPVVTNPAGMHAEVVRHGETGFLAETPAEWAAAIAELAANPELRRRLGAAGRRLVEAQFSVRVSAARWVDQLEQVVGLPSAAPSIPTPHFPRSKPRHESELLAASAAQAFRSGDSAAW